MEAVGVDDLSSSDILIIAWHSIHTTDTHTHTHTHRHSLSLSLWPESTFHPEWTLGKLRKAARLNYCIPVQVSWMLNQKLAGLCGFQAPSHVPAQPVNFTSWWRHRFLNMNICSCSTASGRWEQTAVWKSKHTPDRTFIIIRTASSREHNDRLSCTHFTSYHRNTLFQGTHTQQHTHTHTHTPAHARIWSLIVWGLKFIYGSEPRTVLSDWNCQNHIALVQHLMALIL